jgi:hypothetical protein
MSGSITCNPQFWGVLSHPVANPPFLAPLAPPTVPSSAIFDFFRASYIAPIITWLSEYRGRLPSLRLLYELFFHVRQLASLPVRRLSRLFITPL